jgi:hypothetical protein
MEDLETIITLSSIAYIMYYSLQPNMIFEFWLLHWAKKTLDKQDIDYSELDKETLIELAVDYNKWIKPLGYCVKCFAPWVLLPMVIYTGLNLDLELSKIVYLYVISIVVTIWLAVKI